MIRYSAVESCCYFVLRRLWPNHGAGGDINRSKRLRDTRVKLMRDDVPGFRARLHVRYIWYTDLYYISLIRTLFVEKSRFLFRIFRNDMFCN